MKNQKDTPTLTHIFPFSPFSFLCELSRRQDRTTYFLTQDLEMEDKVDGNSDIEEIIQINVNEAGVENMLRNFHRCKRVT